MSISTVSMAMAQSGMESLLRQDALQMQREAQVLAAPADAASVGSGPGFEQMLRRVDDQEQEAGRQIEAVERGESDDLVGAMLSSQQASLSFSMLMQVRNKVVGAVDELIKLQL